MPSETGIHAGDPRPASPERRCASRRLPPGAPAAVPSVAQGERILEVRRDVLVDRRHPAGATPMLPGDLVVTAQRVLHAGWIVIDVPLRQIQDTVVVGGALMLLLEPGQCLTIQAPDPDAIRRVIAIARADLRGADAAVRRGSDAAVRRGSDAAVRRGSHAAIPPTP